MRTAVAGDSVGVAPAVEVRDPAEAGDPADPKKGRNSKVHEIPTGFEGLGSSEMLQ